MTKWLLTLMMVILGGAIVATDVEAARLGGGRSIGVQRSQTTPPASTPAKPAQQQAAPTQAPQPAPASGLSRWLPMLGGLALGGLLGSMFGGFGGGLGGILLVALLAIGAVLVFRAFAQRRTEEAPRPLQFAGLGGAPVGAMPPAQVSGGSGAAPAGSPGVPAGFDTAGFLRGAKMNFAKLQVANDLGNLDEIREFTTPEMYDVLQRDAAERHGQAAQQTDVVNLDAELLEVATEGDKHRASVRFSGMIREAPGSASEGFEEVWNLVKPADGSTGWLLAGIQQMH